MVRYMGSPRDSNLHNGFGMGVVIRHENIREGEAGAWVFGVSVAWVVIVRFRGHIQPRRR